MLKILRDGCSVGFFGLGRSNISLINSLPLEKCKITLRSDKPIDCKNLPNSDRVFDGDRAYDDLDENVIFFSPSVRRERAELLSAKAKGMVFSSDAELFFAENRRPVIAISGSDGKSTTATLTNMLLSYEGVNSRLIGNIGEPMYAELGKTDRYVAELSSFMLKYCAPKVERACVTNITPNHLDWHKDFEEYKDTKLSLLRSAREFVVTDELSDIPGAYGIISNTASFKSLRNLYNAELYLTLEAGWIFRNGEKVISIEKVRRCEPHNLKNLMMAIALCDGLVSRDGILSVAESFSGLKHRCELFFSHEGVDYYDSSIDTSPARTSATMLSLARRAVVILGGKSKGLDYSKMLFALKKFATAVVLYGENRYEIYSSLSGEVSSYIADDFESAVKLGDSIAREVGALILSPASVSYDSFSDYRQRGETFKRIILDLHKGE